MKLFKNIKTFYFDNMNLINKFWLNQIALSILGIMVCLPMPSFGTAALIIASLFSAIFFISLLYDNAWDEGFKDSNRVSNGRLPLRPFHGAKIAVFAYAPSILFWVLWAVPTLLNCIGVETLNAFGVVGKTLVLFFCNGTYLGLVYTTLNYIDEVYLLLIALVCFIPAIISYGLGYRLGLADKQIKTLFGFKPALGDGAKKPEKSKK